MGISFVELFFLWRNSQKMPNFFLAYFASTSKLRGPWRYYEGVNSLFFPWNWDTNEIFIPSRIKKVSWSFKSHKVVKSKDNYLWFIDSWSQYFIFIPSFTYSMKTARKPKKFTLIDEIYTFLIEIPPFS